MFLKSTFLHLRFPFSFFLLPVFLFAWSLYDAENVAHGWLAFFIIHFLIYPASNGYNSYFDEDEESIGALKNPPPVTFELFRVSLAMDLLALMMGFIIGLQFVIMLLTYGLASKAYSHPSIRLKKYPFISWFIAGFFQGFFTFLMATIALTGLDYQVAINTFEIVIPATLSSMLLWGSYPMTQIYQHVEDSRRGDHTLSILLGIKGTFIFTAIFFSLAIAGFTWLYWTYYGQRVALIFHLFLAPVLVFFVYWFYRVNEDEKNADFRHTMQLNFISAICLNTFFLACYFLYDRIFETLP